MADLLDEIRSLDEPLAAAGDELASVRANLADAVASVANTTDWMLERGLADVRDALAGATPYLRACALVVGGWLMARQALAARTALAAGHGERRVLEAKLTTARFYAEQLLPAVHGLAGPATAGFQVLYELDAAQLSG